MSNGAHFVPPKDSQYRQSYQQQPAAARVDSPNTYNSYASSNTYYDPASQYNAPSKTSSLRYQAQSPVKHEQSANGRVDSPNTASSQHPLHPRKGANDAYQGGQGPYAHGGYAQGPPGNRTPSPTPSEIALLKRGIVDWKVVLNWRTYAKKKYIIWYIILIVILVLVALMTIYHRQIVAWLKPAAQWMQSFKYGWILPIAVLFVISFPPLFGHEIVAVLCGVVWGMWVGFAIVSAGTLLGEIGNFYAFKYCCAARGEKMEKQKLSYACLARVVREGGFKIALIARLSAIPGHFTTAVFSTCGMGIFVFTMAAILSMPKQFITVYLGVILEQSGDSEEEKKNTQTSRIISDVVLAITFLITVAAMWYIWHEMNRVRPAVLLERRKEKKKLAAPSGEAAYLSRESNVDLTSEEEMTPVRNSEPRMGGYGYGYAGGYSPASESNETISAPIPRRAIAISPLAAGGAHSNKEEWAMNEMKSDANAGYPPQANNRNEYERQARHQELFNAALPPGAAQPQPPRAQSQLVSDIPSPFGQSQEQKEKHLYQRPPSSQYESPAPSYNPPSSTGHDQSGYTASNPKPNEYGVGGGLSALGAPLGGGDTVLVTPRNARDGGARVSREVKPSHDAGRSFRAVVEHSDSGEHQRQPYQPSPPPQQQSNRYSAGVGGSDLAYMAASPPKSSDHGHLSRPHQQNLQYGLHASEGTFGTAVPSGPGAYSRPPMDEPFVPPPNRG